MQAEMQFERNYVYHENTDNGSYNYPTHAWFFNKGSWIREKQRKPARLRELFYNWNINHMLADSR